MIVSRTAVISCIIGFVIGIIHSNFFWNQKVLDYKDDVLSAIHNQWKQMIAVETNYRNNTSSKDKVVFHDDTHVHDGEDVIAQELYRNVRISCWVMTSPGNHQSRATHIKATWGKRCNKLVFMSTSQDSDLPAVKLQTEEGYDFLWGKTRQAFEYVYKNHLSEADWFLKADDDTYVILENLRFLLNSHKTTDPIFFGHKFKVIVKQGYFSGGSGYVLSKEALTRFVKIGLENGTLCRPDDRGAEDAELGKCMESLGVTAGDSRDTHGENRFMPFDPETHLFARYPDWYVNNAFYKEELGFGRMSDTAISFHYIQPSFMYVLEYLIYHLRPHGISFTSHHKEDEIAPLSK